MAVLKRCGLCINYLNCIIYDKICENLLFLQNFLDIKESGETAKYCKKYNNYIPKEIKLPKELKNKLKLKWELKKKRLKERKKW